MQNFGQQAAVDASIFEMLTVAQVMKNNPTTITPDTQIREVAEMLAVEEFHALPVVDDDGNLEGIVTTSRFNEVLVGAILNRIP